MPSSGTTAVPKPTSREPGRKFVPAKLDAEVVRLAKIVAAYRGTSLAEYVSDRLVPLVRQDLEAEQRKAAKP